MRKISKTIIHDINYKIKNPSKLPNEKSQAVLGQSHGRRKHSWCWIYSVTASFQKYHVIFIKETDLFSIMEVRRISNSQSGDEKFDVSMESFNKTKVCVIAGFYTLNLLKNSVKRVNVTLYRDEVLRHLNGSKNLK